MYSFRVTNPDGGRATLPDIIIYSDEPFKAAAAAEPDFMSELKAKVQFFIDVCRTREIDLREQEKRLSEEEEARQRAKDEEAKKKAAAAKAAAAVPVSVVPKGPTEEEKKRMEEEKRREARKNWGKPT